MVSVTWEVVPIAIEDRYEIVLEAVFETDVPAPVLTLQPGAVNLPWDSLLKPVTAKRPTPEMRGYFVWREPAEIHALLRAAGITSRQPLAVYDQSGGRAAHVAFALYLMGHSQAVVYSGGWREYGAREDVEIER